MSVVVVEYGSCSVILFAIQGLVILLQCRDYSSFRYW